MKIVCDTTFLDGTTRFEKGDVRTVSDEDGARFIGHGWAHALGDEPNVAADGASTTDLKVDSITHKTGVSNG